MSIVNVHERRVSCSLEQAMSLLSDLSSERDRLWPRDRWPAMRFDRALQVGAVGGHGMIRYRVTEVTSTKVVFEFDPEMGLAGTHCFEVSETDETQLTLFRHTLSAEPSGAMRVSWPLVVGPLHDALVEDAFDGAHAIASGQPVRRAPFSLRVRSLRRLLTFVSISPNASPRKHRTATVTASALAAIGGLHMLWGAGSTWPAASSRDLARLVVGTDTFPPPAACLAVALLLGAAATVVQQSTTNQPKLGLPFARIGTATVAGVLGLRGIGGFVASGVLGRAADLPFRRWDLLLYSPLCVALAIGAWRSAKPESAKPESAKPESAKPESAKPESAKPESVSQRSA
jgi:hypothetical protein